MRNGGVLPRKLRSMRSSRRFASIRQKLSMEHTWSVALNTYYTCIIMFHVKFCLPSRINFDSRHFIYFDFKSRPIRHKITHVRVCAPNRLSVALYPVPEIFLKGIAERPI